MCDRDGNGIVNTGQKKKESRMEIIGEYEYDSKELIGQGAFAIVYKGWHIAVSITFVCLSYFNTFNCVIFY